MYTIQNNVEEILCDVTNTTIPVAATNSDYQRVLDDIIEQGSDCFEGDIPSDLQTAADAKLFAKQVQEYINAKARIAQYQLSVGKPESSQEVSLNYQVLNRSTGAMEDVTETVVTEAILALDATITKNIYDDDLNITGTENVANPLITTDNDERTSAQAVIDATPSAVKTHVDS